MYVTNVFVSLTYMMGFPYATQPLALGDLFIISQRYINKYIYVRKSRYVVPTI